MTCRQKAEKEYPERVNYYLYDGGVQGCPSSWPYKYMDRPFNCNKTSCWDCWSRKIPVQTEIKKG